LHRITEVEDLRATGIIHNSLKVTNLTIRVKQVT